MKFDLHLHSLFSWDSKVRIEEYISKAEKLSYDAISITDHNTIESHSYLDKFQKITNVILIPGQEVSTKDGHLLVYGHTGLIPNNLTMNETILLAHKEKGVCIAAHPYDPLRGGSFSKIFKTQLDGLEILNASAWFNFPNYLAKRAFNNQSLVKIGIGNSDSHRLEEFGSAYSISSLATDFSLDSLQSHLENAIPVGSRIGILSKLDRFIMRKFR